MTALQDPAAHHMSRPAASTDQAPNKHGDGILVGDHVPIAIWRLDDRDDRPSTEPGTRLASRLAQRLVHVYTRRGDAVIDLDNDPHLRTAATAASRAYITITDPSQVADLDTLTHPISLVVLRWPRHTLGRAPASVADFFTACRLIMTTATCAIATIRSSEPGQPGPAYAQNVAMLVPAADAAGLTNVLQIVAVSGPGDGDQFVYYATRGEAEAARHVDAATPDAPTYHVDLLVFTNGDEPL